MHNKDKRKTEESLSREAHLLDKNIKKEEKSLNKLKEEKRNLLSSLKKDKKEDRNLKEKKREIEKKEKITDNPEKKRSIERDRWQTEDERRLVEKRIFKTEKKIRDLEKKIRDLKNKINRLDKKRNRTLKEIDKKKEEKRRKAEKRKRDTTKNNGAEKDSKNKNKPKEDVKNLEKERAGSKTKKESKDKRKVNSNQEKKRVNDKKIKEKRKKIKKQKKKKKRGEERRREKEEKRRRQKKELLDQLKSGVGEVKENVKLDNLAKAEKQLKKLRDSLESDQELVEEVKEEYGLGKIVDKLASRLESKKEKEKKRRREEKEREEKIKKMEGVLSQAEEHLQREEFNKALTKTDQVLDSFGFADRFLGLSGQAKKVKRVKKKIKDKRRRQKKELLDQLKSGVGEVKENVKLDNLAKAEKQLKKLRDSLESDQELVEEVKEEYGLGKIVDKLASRLESKKEKFKQEIEERVKSNSSSKSRLQELKKDLKRIDELGLSRSLSEKIQKEINQIKERIEEDKKRAEAIEELTDKLETIRKNIDKGLLDEGLEEINQIKDRFKSDELIQGIDPKISLREKVEGLEKKVRDKQKERGKRERVKDSLGKTIKNWTLSDDYIKELSEKIKKAKREAVEKEVIKLALDKKKEIKRRRKKTQSELDRALKSIDKNEIKEAEKIISQLKEKKKESDYFSDRIKEAEEKIAKNKEKERLRRKKKEKLDQAEELLTKNHFLARKKAEEIEDLPSEMKKRAREIIEKAQKQSYQFEDIKKELEIEPVDLSFSKIEIPETGDGKEDLRREDLQRKEEEIKAEISKINKKLSSSQKEDLKRKQHKLREDILKLKKSSPKEERVSRYRQALSVLREEIEKYNILTEEREGLKEKLSQLKELEEKLIEKKKREERERLEERRKNLKRTLKRVKELYKKEEWRRALRITSFYESKLFADFSDTEKEFLDSFRELDEKIRKKMEVEKREKEDLSKLLKKTEKPIKDYRGAVNLKEKLKEEIEEVSEKTKKDLNLGERFSDFKERVEEIKSKKEKLDQAEELLTKNHFLARKKAEEIEDLPSEMKKRAREIIEKAREKDKTEGGFFFIGKSPESLLTIGRPEFSLEKVPEIDIRRDEIERAVDISTLESLLRRLEKSRHKLNLALDSVEEDLNKNKNLKKSLENKKDVLKSEKETLEKIFSEYEKEWVKKKASIYRQGLEIVESRIEKISELKNKKKEIERRLKKVDSLLDEVRKMESEKRGELKRREEGSVKKEVMEAFYRKAVEGIEDNDFRKSRYFFEELKKEVRGCSKEYQTEFEKKIKSLKEELEEAGELRRDRKEKTEKLKKEAEKIKRVYSKKESKKGENGKEESASKKDTKKKKDKDKNEKIEEGVRGDEEKRRKTKKDEKDRGEVVTGDRDKKEEKTFEDEYEEEKDSLIKKLQRAESYYKGEQYSLANFQLEKIISKFENPQKKKIYERMKKETDILKKSLTLRKKADQKTVQSEEGNKELKGEKKLKESEEPQKKGGIFDKLPKLSKKESVSQSGKLPEVPEIDIRIPEFNFENPKVDQFLEKKNRGRETREQVLNSLSESELIEQAEKIEEEMLEMRDVRRKAENLRDKSRDRISTLKDIAERISLKEKNLLATRDSLEEKESELKKMKRRGVAEDFEEIKQEIRLKKKEVEKGLKKLVNLDKEIEEELAELSQLIEELDKKIKKVVDSLNLWKKDLNERKSEDVELKEEKTEKEGYDRLAELVSEAEDLFYNENKKKAMKRISRFEKEKDSISGVEDLEKRVQSLKNQTPKQLKELSVRGKILNFLTGNESAEDKKKGGLRELMRSKEVFIGIDISDYSLELLRLVGKKEIASYGRTSFPDGVINKGILEDNKALAKKLEEALLRAEPESIDPPDDDSSSRIFRSKKYKSIVSLPESKTYVQTFTFDSKENLAIKVKKGLERTIPHRPEELYWDYRVLDEKDRVVVFCVATLKKVVDQYFDFLEAFNIPPIAFELKGISLGRALLPKEMSSGAAILDLGSKTTMINLYNSSGALALSVPLPYGGNYLTMKIEDGLEVDTEEAERLKRKEGLAVDSEVKVILEEQLEKIVKEVRRAEDYYRAEFNLEIEDLFLTGGTALIPKIEEFFDRRFEEKEVSTPDPLLKVDGSIGSDENIFYGNVVGLSLRSFEDDQGINLLPSELESEDE